MTIIEKSSDMTTRYTNGVDTWGNRERQLYQKIFKKAVSLVKESLGDSTEDILWYDIGAGGGNIWDTVLENADETHKFKVAGLDLVQTAVDDLNANYPSEVSLGCVQYDLDNFSPADAPIYLAESKVVSCVDVFYYIGEHGGYRPILDKLWEYFKPGTIIVVADSLIPYQRRSYFSTKDDCKTLYSYTDYTEKVSEEVTSSGRSWSRYLKVKIYRKL